MDNLNFKKSLINNNLCIDNEYLEKYIKLIIDNEFTEKQKYITNSHHIIPRIYFKHYNLPIDNNSTNKRNLKISDHILAHYYLYKCAKQEWFKQANLLAIAYCQNYSHRITNITDEMLKELITDYETFKVEFINCLKTNFKKARQHLKNKPLSEETKHKISISKTNPSNLVRKHLRESHLGILPTKETLDKRSKQLRLAHQDPTKYLNVGKKISETKKKNNSGNNRKGKIHIKNYQTNKEKYVLKTELAMYYKLGFELFKLKKDPKLPKKDKKKKVICLETKRIYNSIKEAELQLNIHCIGAACRGVRKTAGGFTWQFFENN